MFPLSEKSKLGLRLEKQQGLRGKGVGTSRTWTAEEARKGKHPLLLKNSSNRGIMPRTIAARNEKICEDANVD